MKHCKSLGKDKDRALEKAKVEKECRLEGEKMIMPLRNSERKFRRKE